MISEAEFSLWNALPQPGLITDSKGRIYEVNAATELFLNAPARRLKERNLKGVLCADPALSEALARADRDQASVFLNKAALLDNAALKNADIQVSVLGGHEGRLLVQVQPRRFDGSFGRGDEVKTAARSAIGMAEMLAHEIKNPLAGITGAAQLLGMSASKEDQELTELIVEESRRIVALLDQVEHFGNLRPPERKVVNIHDLLDRAQRLAEVGFGAHMKFERDYDPSLPPTLVDRDQMMQVFLNLMKNASEVSKKGGLIRLKTSYDHGLRMRGPDGRNTRLPLQVEIIDDGPGIPPDIQRQVFEPFVSGR